MRITKKFAGASCIGKQVFQPVSERDGVYDPELDDLETLRVIFHRRIRERSGSLASSASSSVAPSRRYSFTPEDTLDFDASSAASSFSTTNSNSRVATKFMRDDRDADVSAPRSREPSHHLMSLPSSSSSSSSSSFTLTRGNRLPPSEGGIPHRKYLERQAVEAHGGDIGRIKRVLSAPDLSELRMIQDSGDYSAYGAYGAGLRGLKRKRGFHSLHDTNIRPRSHSVTDFEHYFDDENLAGDLLLQFAGIAPAAPADSEGDHAADNGDSDIGSIGHGPVTKIWGNKEGREGHVHSPLSPSAALRRVMAQPLSPGQPSGLGALAIESFGALKAVAVATRLGSPGKEDVGGALHVRSSSSSSSSGSGGSGGSGATNLVRLGSEHADAPADGATLETAAGVGMDMRRSVMVDQSCADEDDDGFAGVGLDIADGDVPPDAPRL